MKQFSPPSIASIISDRWFKEYTEPEFARSGNKASELVVLPEGPLDQFSHAMEPHLRQLGLPMELRKGVWSS